MADLYDEINELVNKIATGKTNVKEVENTIDRIKDQFGADAFPSFTFNKKPKPWSLKYLRELQKKNLTGACSEEFILHMAKVSDYVFGKRKKGIIGAIIISIIIVLLIIMLVLHVNSSKHKENQSIDNNYIVEEEIKR